MSACAYCPSNSFATLVEGTREYLPYLLLSTILVGVGTVKLSRADVLPRHVLTSTQSQIEEAPVSTLTRGGCEDG